uniref:Uncharacterized protein n=1 Tax=Acrobeloides nanus TaxID=290746 RepID=A0A914ECZ0_9BILA
TPKLTPTIQSNDYQETCDLNKANPLRHKVDENLFMVLSTKKINGDVQYLEQWYRQIFQNAFLHGPTTKTTATMLT